MLVKYVLGSIWVLLHH